MRYLASSINKGMIFPPVSMLAFFTLGFVAGVQSGEKDIDVQMVRNLLYGWEEPPGKITLGKRAKLISFGHRVFPAFVNILKQSESSIEISRVLAIVHEIEGDKSSFIPPLKGLLRRDNVWIRASAIWALGKLGSSKDCLDVIPLLDDHSEIIRTNAARLVGKLGEEGLINLVKEVIERRGDNHDQENLKRDYSFAEMCKAIRTITRRWLKEKIGSEKDDDVKMRYVRQLDEYELREEDSLGERHESISWLRMQMFDVEGKVDDYERKIAIRAIGRLGDEKAADEIESTLNKWKADRKPEDAEKSDLFEEGYKAVKAIRKRCKNR